MKVAILTSGGDAPGMNACVSNLVEIIEKCGYECYVYFCGYQGVLNNDIKKTTRKEMENISHLGGSVIKSFRCLEFKTEKGLEKAVANLKENEIDFLVIIGGDGSFKGAAELSKRGIKIIGIPATIDNDLFYTDRTLGFDTAVNNAVEAIDKIRQTMASLNRVSVCEVMGRHCSDITVYTAVATNAEAAIFSEKYDYNEILERVKKSVRRGQEAPTIILRENVMDINEFVKKLQNDLDLEVRANIIGYIQRGGAPTVFDRIFAKQLSYFACQLIKNNIYNVVIGIKDNEIIKIPVEDFESVNNRKENGLYKCIY